MSDASSPETPDAPAAGRKELGVRASVALVLSSQLAGAMAMVGVPVVLTRLLTQVDYGLYQQFQLLQQTFLILAIAGFPDALIYFVARRRGSAADFLLGALIQLATVLALIAALLLLAGPWIVESLADPSLVPLLLPLFLAVACYAVGDTLFQAQTAQKRFRTYATIYVIFAYLQSALLIGAAWIWRTPVAVVWAMVAGGGLKGVAALVWIALEVRRTGWSARPRMLREQWVYSLPFAGTQILKKIRGQLHKYFVTASFSADAFAIYDIGTKKVPALGLLRGSVVQVMTPHFAEMEAVQRHRAMLSLWHASASRLALAYYPLAVLLLVFAPDLIAVLFPPEYAGATPIFQIFTLLMVGEALGGLEALLKAFAQNRFILWTTGFQLGVALVGSWVGLKWIGLPGPAIAAVAAGLLGQWIRLYRVRVLLNVGVRDLLPWSQMAKVLTVAGGACGLAWLASRPLPSPLLALALGVPLAVALMLAGALRLGLVPETERAALKKVARRVGLGS